MSDSSAAAQNIDSARSGKSRFSISILLILILLFYCFLKVWSWGAQAPRDDFFQMWRGGMLIENASAGQIYAPKLRGYHAGTPFLYTVFSALSSGDFDLDYQVYRHLVILCGMVAIGFFCRYLKYPLAASLAAVIVFTEWFQPFLTDIHVANVNCIQLALLALFLLMQKKQSSKLHNFLGGAVLGFAVMLKPNLLFVPAILGISWLINKKLRTFIYESAGIATVVVLAFGLSSWAFGSVTCWRDWMQVIREVGNYMLGIDTGNFALATLIREKVGIRASSFLALLFLLLPTLVLWAGQPKTVTRMNEIGESEKEAYRDFLMVALGCLIYVLSSPMVWVHYYVLAIPAALFALRPLRDTGQKSLVRMTANVAPVVLAIVLLAEFPVRTLFGVADSYIRASLLCLGTLILFAWGIKDLYRLSTNGS
jgi:hypothetical protein